jgi:hypothetical protein
MKSIRYIRHAILRVINSLGGGWAIAMMPGAVSLLIHRTTCHIKSIRDITQREGHGGDAWRHRHVNTPYNRPH